MATIYERLLDESQAACTVYGPADSTSRATSVLISNIRGLGTERVVSDFSAGWMDTDDAVLPGNTIDWQGGRYLVVKTTKGAQPLLMRVPLKVQVLHLPYAVPRYRAGVPGPTARFVPEVSITLKSETEVPLDRISCIAPFGTDLRVNDTLVWDGWSWFVRDVTPGVFDGHEYARKFDIVRLGYANGPQTYLFTNCTLLRYRGSRADVNPATLRCRWYASSHNHLTPEGEVLPTAIFFAHGTDLTKGDIFGAVTWDTPDGSASDPDPSKFWIVDVVEPEGAPLPIIRVQVKGGQQGRGA